MIRRTFLAALLAVVAGCGKDSANGDASKVVVVTNEIVRYVAVTNFVEAAPPGNPHRLSLRKTMPYVVTSDTLAGERLATSLSAAGARVVSIATVEKAIVEATDRAAEAIRDGGLCAIRALAPEEKLHGVAGGGAVKIIPLSSIDAGPISSAVKKLGGEPVAEIVGGRTEIRAELSHEDILKLAERGDVRKLEGVQK